MRTTLDIDEDIFLAAKKMASSRRISLGKALSELARQALGLPTTAPAIRNGVPLLPKRPGEHSVSLELVNRLRDQE